MSKRPGLMQPKPYRCPGASRFLAGCFWVFRGVTPTGRRIQMGLKLCDAGPKLYEV